MKKSRFWFLGIFLQKILFIGFLILSFLIISTGSVKAGCTGSLKCQIWDKDRSICTSGYYTIGCEEVGDECGAKKDCAGKNCQISDTCASSNEPGDSSCGNADAPSCDGWCETEACIPKPGGGDYCVCGGGCGITSPTDLAVGWLTGNTQAQITWTPGIHGRWQTLYVSDKWENINGSKPPCGDNTGSASDCIIKKTVTNFEGTEVSHPTWDSYTSPARLLDYAETYYWRVFNLWNTDKCYSGSLIVKLSPPICNTTAPAITLPIVRGTPQTTATVRWNSGSNGTSERLYFDTDKTDIDTAQPCPSGQGTGPGKCTYVNLNASSPQVVTGLALNTTYYVRVQNYKNATCSSNSPFERYLSSCTLSPSSIDLSTEDDPLDLTSGVKCSTEIQRVDFSSQDPGTASVSPSSDTSCALPANPYKTQVSPKKKGSTTISSTVYFTDITTAVCTSQVNATIINPGPWWQVKDGDVSSGGNLRSTLPSGEFFDLTGAGGNPGVPAYNGTSAGFGNGEVSETGWLAQSPSSGSKVFDYQYFANQIPQDIVPTQITSSSITSFPSAPIQMGYKWYKYTGTTTDLSIDANIALGSNKVILLVESVNLNINGKINLADGQGFFLAIVKGKINISPGIGGGAGPHLEGLYFADGTISTGTTEQENDTQLKVRGSLAASGTGEISIQRNLGGSNDSPAEIFEYAPDQVILFPPKLSTRRINWKEVAP